MKLSLKDVKAIGVSRYQAVKKDLDIRRIWLSIGCIVLGLILIVTIFKSQIAPLDQKSVRTIAIPSAGELVITGGHEIKFNGAPVPSIFSWSGESPDASDYVVLGVGFLLLVVGFGVLFSAAIGSTEERDKFVEAFVQKWLDTGEIPPAETNREGVWVI